MGYWTLAYIPLWTQVHRRNRCKSAWKHLQKSEIQTASQTWTVANETASLWFWCQCMDNNVHNRVWRHLNSYKPPFMEIWESRALLIISLDFIFLDGHPQGVYCNCVKFHQYWFIHLQENGHTTDSPTGWFLFTQIHFG